MKRSTSFPIGFALVCSSTAGLLAGAAVDANGVPHKRYRKDLISVGRWVMPDGGKEFVVTAATMDKWISTFAAMDAAGVKVPVPLGHTFEPAKNAGYVRGLWREGDTLYGDIELIGADAIELASKTEVSIYVPAELVDGKGVAYAFPIAHVALTPVPVVNGQDSFVPIAASRGVVKVPALMLAKENVMDLKALAAKLGVDSTGVDDEALWAACLAKIDAMKEEMSRAKGDAPAVAEARKELEAAKVELARLKLPPEKPAAMLLKLAGENRRMKIDALVAGGKLVPAAAKKLSAVYAEGDGLALSMDAAGDAEFDAVVAALSENDPAKLGEQVKSHSLSRAVPGDNRVKTDDLVARLVGA